MSFILCQTCPLIWTPILTFKNHQLLFAFKFLTSHFMIQLTCPLILTPILTFKNHQLLFAFKFLTSHFMIQLMSKHLCYFILPNLVSLSVCCHFMIQLMSKHLCYFILLNLVSMCVCVCVCVWNFFYGSLLQLPCVDMYLSKISKQETQRIQLPYVLQYEVLTFPMWKEHYFLKHIVS